jgi:hypothetical protein
VGYLRCSFRWNEKVCVIQGDVADWEKESATMSQVYSNAIVTIAAAREDHCEGEFLNKAEKVKLQDKLKYVHRERRDRVLHRS